MCYLPLSGLEAASWGRRDAAGSAASGYEDNTDIQSFITDNQRLVTMLGRSRAFWP